MQSHWITILLLANSLMAFGGFGEKPPVKWGKVAPSEFEVQLADEDTSYHAIVLCDYQTIKVTNRSIYSRHTRIRIQDEEGLAYARIEIPYQTAYNQDRFLKIKAQTVLLRNGKAEVIKADRHQITDVRIDDSWSKKVIIFPNVEPGAIIEYSYTLASLDFEDLYNWYFQREIPTLWSEVRFQVPGSLAYLVTFQNNRKLLWDEERIIGESLMELYAPGKREPDGKLANRENLLFQTQESSYQIWLINNYKKKIVMRNLPGLVKSDGNRVNPDRYPQVRMHLFESYGNLQSGYRTPYMTGMEDFSSGSRLRTMDDGSSISGNVPYRLRTWPEMNVDLLEHERFGRILMQHSDMTDLIDSLTYPGMLEKERIKAVYDYVRYNFKWNGIYSMYATMEMNDLLESRTGTSADLNLFLVYLLRRAGLEADPVLIRTNDLGWPELLFPVSNQFNHVIALIYVNEQRILLDTSSGEADYSLLNKKNTDTNGWVVNSSNPGWLYIYSRVIPEDMLPSWGTGSPLLSL